MKVKIKQLDEEVNERNVELIIQQLKKENDQLHQLVNKHHELNVKRISVGSQIKHVGIICVCYNNDSYVYYTYVRTYVHMYVLFRYIRGYICTYVCSCCVYYHVYCIAQIHW